MDARTLVVDLDGTLIRSDMLFESFWAAFARRWTVPFQSLAALGQGRAALKELLGRLGPVEVASLPYNEAVVSYVRRWREGGGRTALVTASNKDLAEGIAAHLGLFDEVHGSDGSVNLKGGRKAEFLVSRFGAGGFDYIGDAEADLPVWAQSGKAIVVASSPGLGDRIKSGGGEVERLEGGRSAMKHYLKEIRPHQWLKNLLVFLPMLAAHQFTWPTFLQALLAFAAFSLTASSVYVLNDLLDLSADRAHPRKRNRPFASGAIPIAHGSVMAPALLLVGLALAVPLGWEFFGVMVSYIVLTTAYSLYLKRRLVVDIVALATLYTLRIVAGGVATEIGLSVWLLAFSVFFFFSLAAVKRQAELVDGVSSGKKQAAGRGYVSDDLHLVETMATGSGYVSVLVMALYLNSPNVQVLYNQPAALWGICMVLLYWISRMVMLTHRGQMNDDPVVFAARDGISLLSAALILGCAVAGVLL
jgi:4-hydroxybenzoate polyprenyltransferase/phosphoserine phosphatase